MTKVILTRHGEVEGINPPRFRGRREIPLTALGRKQASAVAVRIAATNCDRISAIYTSPLGRCVHTGAAIADACDREGSTLPSLLDLDYGAWEWRSYEEMRREEPELFERWFETPQLMRFPNGESLQELVARGADVLRTVIARHPGGTVVLVGHASINRAILLQVLDQPLSAYWRLEPLPCSISEFELAEGHPVLLRYNDISHLSRIIPETTTDATD